MSPDRAKKRRSKPNKTAEPASKGKGDSGKNELELLNVTRDSFRRPLADGEKATIRISGQPVKTINLSLKGIGILVQKQNVFSPGDELPEISIDCKGNQISLQGRVVHITPAESGDYLCGVQFHFAGEKEIDRFRKYVEENHSELFF